ncbi:hypothetical protein JCM19241_1837 [Vibrio ishigakensis]|uniref:Uncharacterized protein n=1 Tax=Vibrio ishigakensis TaxID=1481914 RepID=A0A0B8QJX5_9VIBR|nr:hypothetical protein JCM19241_1837 [Vibrio ishigakensis]
MTNILAQLSELTTIVADTGEIEAIKNTNLKTPPPTHLLF